MRAAHKRVAVIVLLTATSASACASDVRGMQGQDADAGTGGGNGGRGGAAGSTLSEAGGATSSTGGGGGIVGAGGAGGQPIGGGGVGGTVVAANLRDIVARLSGESPIDGVNVLRHRASETEREAVRVYLIQILNAAGLIGQRQTYATGTNVFADLPTTTGADQPYVIFGAHYDGVSAGPGANDNATGVAAVLAVAEHVARLTQRSKNFTFVLFDEEETGLRGSASFAARLVSQGRTVHSAHTIDQMGWDADGDRAIELEMPDPVLQSYYQQVVKAGGFKIPLEITDTTSTDHDSFRARGFPAIGITEEFRNNDTTPYYHKAGDTYATVNFDYLDSTVGFMKYLMADLAK